MKLAPTQRTFVVLASVALALFAAVLIAFAIDVRSGTSFLPIAKVLAKVVAIALIATSLLDLLSLLLAPQIVLSRKTPNSLALNRYTTIKMSARFVESSKHTAAMAQSLRFSMEVFDHFPAWCQYKSLPMRFESGHERDVQIAYQLRANKRGLLKLDKTSVKTLSLLKLWAKIKVVPLVDEIKVFPDFSSIQDYILLAMENRSSELGIKTKQRRGQGTAFHQLREFREGDSLKQIDWKATAKRRELISKEYQEERDQSVCVLIDAGQRMSTQDESLSHFDHSLNALLLISYIALKQGDSVSAMTFGAEQRWVPPQKGLHASKTLLANLYDLYADDSGSDYLVASQALLKHQKKRALVVIITNAREQDREDLRAAIKLLRRKHLVLVANLKEGLLAELASAKIESEDDALSYLGLIEHTAQREETIQTLRHDGIFAFESTAKELAVKVANSYLEIKRAGIL